MGTGTKLYRVGDKLTHFKIFFPEDTYYIYKKNDKCFWHNFNQEVNASITENRKCPMYRLIKYTIKDTIAYTYKLKGIYLIIRLYSIAFKLLR